jgi:hypothetical protein
MTVNELFQSACRTFGVEESNARFQGDFYAGVTAAQNGIANRRHWGFLVAQGTVTTAADTRTATMPTDFGRFAIDDHGTDSGQVRITAPAGSAGGTIKVIKQSEYLKQSYDGDDTGTPENMWLIGDTAYFSPIPDDEYTIEFLYYKRPTKITNNNGTIVVPDRYAELIEAMIFRFLKKRGYSPIQELQIEDADVKRLLGESILDDIARYGGPTFNLQPSEFTTETI